MLALVHVPEDVVSVSPTWAVPVIFGSAVLTGAALLAASERPATASTVMAPAASSARRFDLRVMRSPSSRLQGLSFPLCKRMR